MRVDGGKIRLPNDKEVLATGENPEEKFNEFKK